MTEVSIPASEVYEHILVLGAPGAGKSASIFVPNLLRQAELGVPRNLVVTDPKGELLRLTGPAFRAAGARVWIFAPMMPEISTGWNMLSTCTDWDAADRISQCVILNTGIDKTQPFFHETARVLLTLILLQCRALLRRRATMNHVHAAATWTTIEELQAFTTRGPDQAAAMQAQGFWSRVEKNPRLMGSVTMEFPQRFALWSLPQVRQVSHEGTEVIDFAEFFNPEHRTVLFVVAPMERKEQLKPLMSTFFSEFFFTALAVAKQEPGARLRRPTWFLLDEFANVGQIPNFSNVLTVSRGHGIGLVMGIQSRSQLADVYGEEDAETIQNACATYVVYPRVGPDDAEWLSRILGETTVLTSSKSWEPGDLFAKRSRGEARRRLLTADEIRALPKDRIFVLAGTRRPVLLRQCRWFEQQRWQGLQPAELEAFAHGRQAAVPSPAELLAELGIRPAGRPAAEPAPAAAEADQIEIREVEL